MEPGGAGGGGTAMSRHTISLESISPCSNPQSDHTTYESYRPISGIDDITKEDRLKKDNLIWGVATIGNEEIVRENLKIWDLYKIAIDRESIKHTEKICFILNKFLE